MDSQTRSAQDDDTVVYPCSSCGGKNRILRARLREDPTCGRCKEKIFPRRPVTVTDASWKHEVEDSPIPVLVDFWAPWCGPCRMVAPVVEEIAQERGDQVKVVKLNIDENQNIAVQFNVLSIPTLMVFRNGEVAKTVIGAYPKRKLEAELEPVLA